MNKAMELKKMMESINAKLENITVEGKAGDGIYTVITTVTATKKVKNIAISEALLKQEDKEYLEDLILTALNRALDQAQMVADTEGRNSAMSGLLGM